MPLNASGEYVWLQAETRPYLYIEGEILTDLDIRDIRTALGATLVRQPTVSNDSEAYLIPAGTIFDLLFVRDDKRFALVARTPVPADRTLGTATATLFTQMRADIESAGNAIIQAIRPAITTLAFEKLDCQIAVPF